MPKEKTGRQHTGYLMKKTNIYRFVEPTGATPFSKPARERALHAVLAALLRQKESLIEDTSANNFDSGVFAKDIEEIRDFIISRIEEINARAGSALENDITDVQEEIWEFVDFWQSMVEKAHTTITVDTFNQKLINRLRKAAEKNPEVFSVSEPDKFGTVNATFPKKFFSYRFVSPMSDEDRARYSEIAKARGLGKKAKDDTEICE